MAFPAKTDRTTILMTAMEQVQREGTGKLAIRSVATALGLAPNALYRYFSSLAALQAALAEESQRRLLEVLQRAAGKKGPEAAIRSIAQAYVRFAREQPHVFAMTLMAPEERAGVEAVHVQMWRFVVGQVAAVYGEARAPKAAVALWAFLHGFTALEAAGVFGERKPMSSFSFGLRLWVVGASVGVDRSEDPGAL